MKSISGMGECVTLCIRVAGGRQRSEVLMENLPFVSLFSDAPEGKHYQMNLRDALFQYCIYFICTKISIFKDTIPVLSGSGCIVAICEAYVK